MMYVHGPSQCEVEEEGHLFLPGPSVLRTAAGCVSHPRRTGERLGRVGTVVPEAVFHRPITS
eukprot:5094654-Alexandrium_andersonii.AAC.1